MQLSETLGSAMKESLNPMFKKPIDSVLHTRWRWTHETTVSVPFHHQRQREQGQKIFDCLTYNRCSFCRTDFWLFMAVLPEVAVISGRITGPKAGLTLEEYVRGIYSCSLHVLDTNSGTVSRY